MADPFAAAIDTVMTGLGYQCQQVALPEYRDYDPALPTLFIAPRGRPLTLWIAFATVGSRQLYDLVWLWPNSLSAQLVDAVWTFKQDAIDEFMGLNATMLAAGAWNTLFRDVEDYSQFGVKKGYDRSACQVLVDYVAK